MAKTRPASISNKESPKHIILVTNFVSKDEIFSVVSKDGVSEAAIIKWIILEAARQDGMSRKEINRLIQSIVLETNASNTPENIANIFAKKEFKDFIQDKDDIDVVVIQTPFSQTRAGSTLKKFLNANTATLGDKNFDIYNMSFDITSEVYHYGNVSALNLSLGEWVRLIAYALKGDIVPVIDNQEGLKAIPLDILVNLLSLLPLLNAEEKASLYKVFSDAAKQDDKFKKENMDKLNVKIDNQVMFGISPGMTTQELINSVSSANGSATITDIKGNKKSSGKLVTGDIITISGSVEKKDSGDVSALLVCLICDFVCKQ